MEKTKNVIEVKDLVKRYDELVAIDHLSLEVEEGEIFGLLGPNGSGKSTLIHSILSLLSYDSGEINVFGQPMSPEAREIKQQIGFVPQQVSVYQELTVYENIDYFCSLYIPDKAKRRELVEEAIDFVQIEDFRKFRPKKLSGGLLRRLNLACGIAHRPRLIFLDEPTVAVDPQSRNKIMEGIRQLKQEGATIVYTTHYMEEVEKLCDRLVILDRGKLIASGSIEEILQLSSIGETIEILSYDLEDAFIRELESRPEVLSLSYQEGQLVLKMKGKGDYLIPLMHQLDEKGIVPLSISSQRPNLNDVFLEITGKELRDHA